MKKVVFIACIFVLMGVQNVFSQFRFGVEAGYVLNHFHLSHDAGRSQNGNGFKIGGIATYQFNNLLFLETGFSYQQKKGALTGLDLPNSVQAINEIRLDYYTLPIMVGAMWNVKGISLGVKAGGYLACGGGSTGLISGRDHSGQEYVRREKLFADNQLTRPFNRFDGGVVCGAEVGYRHLQLRAAYELGFGYVNSIIQDLHNRTFTLSLAYFL